MELADAAGAERAARGRLSAYIGDRFPGKIRSLSAGNFSAQNLGAVTVKGVEAGRNLAQMAVSDKRAACAESAQL